MAERRLRIECAIARAGLALTCACAVAGPGLAWAPEPVVAPGPQTGTLSLEAGACPDDDLATLGFQVVAELWMRDVVGAASGFQAFIEFDPTRLVYRGDLSSYTSTPFPLHIQDIATADVSPGELRLDGSDDLGDPGTDGDALLATLIFDVPLECETTSLDFDLDELFGSELSFFGLPLVTDLVDTGPLLLDFQRPIVTAPPDIVVNAYPGGCTAGPLDIGTATATDLCDPAPVITAVRSDARPLGDPYPVGETIVTWTATDACGYFSSRTQTVTVEPFNTVFVEINLVGVHIPVTRCIHFVTDECDTFLDLPIEFVDHDLDDANGNGLADTTEGGANLPSTPVRAVEAFELPCNDWTMLCAKDRQHTLWATSDLVPGEDGSFYVASSAMQLRPGDTDDNGEVDATDVAFLVATFGDLALSGGCPHDGTQDADFSNNGAVGSEDYSLLTAHFQHESICACDGPAPVMAGSASIPIDALPPHLRDRADLNRDGRFDAADVTLFELRHHLSGKLSLRMRMSDRARQEHR